MDAADKPDRGPVQPGWASTDSPRPAALISAPIPIIPGGGIAPRIRVDGEGVGRPFQLAAPHPPPWSERSRGPLVARRRRAAAHHPRARLPAARPRCDEAAAYDGDEAAAGGAMIGGVDDEPEGQALVVGGSWR